MAIWVRIILGFLVIAGAGYASLHYHDRIPQATEREAKVIAAIYQAVSSNDAELQSWSRQENTSETQAAFAQYKNADVELSYVLIDTKDQQRIFESSPLSPVDLTTVVRQLRKHKTLGVYFLMPLVWESPNEVSVQLLQAELGDLSNAIVCVDLRRSPSVSDQPAAIEKWSIDVNDISGDHSSLPKVNRLDFIPATLGGLETAVGFRSLGSEEYAESIIAIWENRVVFHASLLALLKALNLSLEEVRLEFGSHLVLGSKLRIPIDAYGRVYGLKVKERDIRRLPAGELIVANDELVDELKNKLVFVGQEEDINGEALRIFHKLINAPALGNSFQISTMARELSFGYIAIYTALVVLIFSFCKPFYQFTLWMLLLACLCMLELYFVENLHISLPIVISGVLIFATLIYRFLFLKNTVVSLPKENKSQIN